MQRLLILSGAVLTAFLILLLMTSGIIKEKAAGADGQKVSGTAIIMTGAAARIPQEAALLEELYNRGLMKDVVFISGVSSGALNSVILNGILSGKMTWSQYRNILFSLKNSDIYTQDKKKLPVNTKPLRQFITRVVEGELGYVKIGDLPYMTEISFTHLKDLDMKKEIYRMCSRKINAETDLSLSLVDILMASTSFPIAFPPVRIKNVTTIPDVEYIDGGVGDDHVPYEALLEFEKFRGESVERVYFISRKSDSIPEVSEELRVLGIDDRGRFDKLGISLDNILARGMLKRLKSFADQAPQLVGRSYVWIPDFQKDFLMFNFSNMREQYELTGKWAKDHDPVPLEDYLAVHSKRK